MWINSEIFSLGLAYFSGIMFNGGKLDAHHTKSAESRGFGDDIPWKYLDDALAEAKSQRAPIMLIIHKSWCPSCKALKPVFSASQEIQSLSSKFIMVNTVDNEEPRGKEYAPDGAYIPRILFLNKDGEVMTQFYNDIGHPTYKYYYSDSPSIIRTMKRVLQAHDIGGSYIVPGPPRAGSDTEEFVTVNILLTD